MPKDYAALPANEVRRADRAMNDEAWIADMLHRAAIGYLATVHDGQPFINSNLFVYDDDQHAIYMHTARVGRTRANIEDTSPARVCFTVSEMGRLLPADEALEFSVEYSGVVVFGTAQIIEDRAEQERTLQLLLDKYFPHLKPGEHYRPIVPEELARTSVYRIDIESWSGKRKKVEDDFPGAFLYGEPPIS
jgi:nitroimidazol reductase NimA-like FMN-containing flavoprotein (pyridoxamine 5'-phosphate oxidase superfamily)